MSMRAFARSGLIVAAVFFLASLFLPCQLLARGHTMGPDIDSVFVTVWVRQILPWTAILASAGLVAASVPLRGWPAIIAAVIGLGTVAYHAARFWFWGSFVWNSTDRALYGYTVHLWACGAAMAMTLAVLAVEAAGVRAGRKVA